MKNRTGTEHALGFLAAATLAIAGTAASCPQGSGPPPAAATLEEVFTDIGRGGRSVAVSVSAADPQIAIVGSESGGLFRTTDGGATWAHLDNFAPFRIQDVAFAEPGTTNTALVIVTTSRDAQTNGAANNGGVWRSADAGLTWSHVSHTVCPNAHTGFGIDWAGTGSVFVATECGLLASTDLGVTWTNIRPGDARTVVARPQVIDLCTTGTFTRYLRSTDGGATFTARSSGLSCDTPHAFALAPTDNNTVYAVFTNDTLKESRDGGVTWPTDLGATTYNNRPEWVRTRQSMDGNAATFNLHYSGRIVTCFYSATPRCPVNVSESWPRLPASALNHDINGLAFRPASPCPQLMVADYGVYRTGPATAGLPCGNPAAWSHVGKASSGLHSLQIFQVAGQVQFPLTGPGVSVPGSTHLFLGTMDNLVWGVYNAGPAGWQGYGAEGSFLQVVSENSLLPAAQLQLTFMEIGSLPSPTAQKLVPRPGGASWYQPQLWTSVTPPGNGMPPVLISPGTYVQWSAPFLFLTTDGGASFTPFANLPTNPITTLPMLGIARFGSTQLTKTSAGPAVYEFVTDGTNTGLGLLTQIAVAPAIRPFELRTFGGLGGTGLSRGPTGLAGIASHCAQAIYCPPVFAVDPTDYRNLIAADTNGHMARSQDAGRNWQAMDALNNLVTQNGAISFHDALGGPQVHVIAYDPGNAQHVLVGTDQAGIMASANGGLTWSALPATTKATAITSFFYDAGTNVVWVATYGRGLWKLTVDWSTVGRL